MVEPTSDIWEVESPAEFLRNENGEFEVTSPYGAIFEVICRRGSQMSVYEVGRPQWSVPNGEMWRIRRLHGAVAESLAS